MARGFIEKRPNGTLRIGFDIGFNSDGTRKYIRKTLPKGTKEREAQEILRQMMYEYDKGILAEPQKLLFRDFLKKWLDDMEPALSPKTHFRYKELIQQHISPRIGQHKIEKIRPAHIQGLYTALQKPGARLDGKEGVLSAQTILHIHRLLHRIFQTAIAWQIIPKNPVDGATPPKVPKSEMNILNEEQAKKMFELAARENLQYYCTLLIAIFGGLRRSEIMGVRWRDVDFDNHTIAVNQVSQYVPGQGIIFKEPKTKGSRRTVSLTPAVFEALQKLKESQEARKEKLQNKWKDTGLVFVTHDGGPMHPDSITSWFPAFMEDNDLPKIRFHDLRHTSATLMIMKNVPMKLVSTRLGHSSIGITVDTYTHAVTEAEKQAARALDHILANQAEPAAAQQAKEKAKVVPLRKKA